MKSNVKIIPLDIENLKLQQKIRIWDHFFYLIPL